MNKFKQITIMIGYLLLIVALMELGGKLADGYSFEVFKRLGSFSINYLEAFLITLVLVLVLPITKGVKFYKLEQENRLRKEIQDELKRKRNSS